VNPEKTPVEQFSCFDLQDILDVNI